MKRQFRLCAVILASLSVIIAIIAGCSSAYRESSTRMQTGGTLYSTKNPQAALARDPTGRRIIEGQPSEELWIIGRNRDAQAVGDEQIPGGGVLATQIENKVVPIPLKHTDVKASIAGYIATVDVTQEYQNPYDGKIEAVYVFPLPDNAAVSEFVMTIGQRRIRGIIREREEAERIYKDARSQGYVASLMTQERPNIFTQRVANIEPGKKIDVNVKYFSALEYADGYYEFTFPMVVGPRFNPPGSADGIGAKANGAARLSSPKSAVGSTGQRTEIPYLRAGQRSGHDISLTLDIDAGIHIEQIDSVNHRVNINPEVGDRAHVTLAS